MKPLLRMKINSFNALFEPYNDQLISTAKDQRKSITSAIEAGLAQLELIPTALSFIEDPSVRQKHVEFLTKLIDDQIAVSTHARDMIDWLDNQRKAVVIFKDETINFFKKVD